MSGHDRAADVDETFRDLREGDTFRFRHHPDDGPFVKISAREYLSLTVRRVRCRSAPVVKDAGGPAIEHLARLAARQSNPIIDAIAAAALEREIDVDAIAEEFVAGLFRNSAGVAERLVLMTADGKDLGGWARGPVKDAIARELRRVAAPPAIFGDRVEDDQISRLVLALRATSVWFHGRTGDLCRRLADCLENPHEARAAIAAALELERPARR